VTHLNEQLVRLYDTVFDRAPDPEGQAFWNNSLDHGYSFTVLADHFMRAPEFAATYGQPTNHAFVESLYQNILDRPGEADGIAFWTAALDDGRAQRAETVVGFSESQEHIVHMAAPTAVSQNPAPSEAAAPAPAVATSPEVSPVAPAPVPSPAAEPVPVAPAPVPTPAALPPDTTTLPETHPGPYTLEQPTGLLTKDVWTYHEGETLVGGEGRDKMYGWNTQNVTMWGQGGDDVLLGGPGNDILHGGEGNDTLNGGAGDDRLFGGPGADVFVFNAPDFGHDYVGDFQLGVDLLDFRGLHAAYRGQSAFVANGQPQIRFEDNWTLRHEANAHMPGGSLASFDANGDTVADATVSVFNVLLTDASFLI
jgi:hypothetical protein